MPPPEVWARDRFPKCAWHAVVAVSFVQAEILRDGLAAVASIRGPPVVARGHHAVFAGAQVEALDAGHADGAEDVRRVRRPAPPLEVPKGLH